VRNRGGETGPAAAPATSLFAVEKSPSRSSSLLYLWGRKTDLPGEKRSEKDGPPPTPHGKREGGGGKGDGGLPDPLSEENPDILAAPAGLLRTGGDSEGEKGRGRMPLSHLSSFLLFLSPRRRKTVRKERRKEERGKGRKVMLCDEPTTLST